LRHIVSQCIAGFKDAAGTSGRCLDADNNIAERAVSGIGNGRKTGSSSAADYAPHCSHHADRITSATRQHLDPFAYLRDLVRRLPTTAEDDLVHLLPNHRHSA
jgi:hypothetical protein